MFINYAWFGAGAILLNYGKLRFFSKESKVGLTSTFVGSRAKLIIAACGLLSPGLTGLLVCSLWYETHYLKARQANLIAMMGLGVRILLHGIINTPY